jgi:bacteriophage HK97-gp10 putative tail-component
VPDGLRFEGIETMASGLLRRADRFEKFADKIAFKKAEKIETRAKQLAPLKTGRLRDSSVIFKLRETGARTGYGVAFTAPYAAPVHYDPTAFHPVGTDRYLQIALQEHSRELINDLEHGWSRS